MFFMHIARREGGVMALRARYPNLYVPSDFFNLCAVWLDAFPAYRPFQLGQQSCSFHVMHKDVPRPNKGEASTADPQDIDHRFSAKVNAGTIMKSCISSY